jgi:GNAT superfamily N-acetyltransferase
VPHVIELNPSDLGGQSQLASPSALWMAGAFAAGELAGLIQACGSPFEGYAETTLFVQPKWRRQGIGTLLLEAAMDWALRRQLKMLRVICARTDWPMRHFAEKRGARLDLAFDQIVADISLGRTLR